MARIAARTRQNGRIIVQIEFKCAFYDLFCDFGVIFVPNVHIHGMQVLFTDFRVFPEPNARIEAFLIRFLQFLDGQRREGAPFRFSRCF